jgi:broad-specificity NMP kinase
MPEHDKLIVIAGVCGSGKSTLVQGLQSHGYKVHSVAQEHSYAPKMWRMKLPEHLIMLDCSLEKVRLRRKIHWNEDRLVEQRYRLRNARENCGLYINTENLSIQEVLETALDFLKESEHTGGDTGASQEKPFN